MLTSEQIVKLVQQNRIDFKVPMSKLHDYGFVKVKSSNDREDLVDCIVDETQYKVKDKYKITLKAKDSAYGYEHYYIMDLASLINRGIIKATIRLN